MPTPEQPATTPPGSTIRALRKAKQWTQEDLAKRAGIDRATVSRIERNERYELATLKKIANGLGVELSDLFSEPRTAAWKLLPNAVREDILDYADMRIALWERKNKLPKPPQ